MKLDELAGVGKSSADRVAELGIHTPLDLLNDFPFRYDDLRVVTPAAELAKNDGVEENAIGTIVWVRERRARRLAIVEAELADESGSLTAKWFGRSYLMGALRQGMRLLPRGGAAWRSTRTFRVTMVPSAEAAIPGWSRL